MLIVIKASFHWTAKATTKAEKNIEMPITAV